ncbi:hypothetical protein ACFU7Z_30235 [Kitasatospora sp. NPDC057518]|uniref:hypothetical protein n=1 Tax=Kitasatospora sp. NPDC057518 TaxID=3346155 RepID=UPI003681B815
MFHVFQRRHWMPGAIAAVAVEAAGMILVGIALFLPGEQRDIAWTGLAVIIASLPAVIVTQQARASHLKEDERSAIYMDGYRMALQHMAEGLLAHPGPPDPRPRSHEPAAPNVVYLKPRAADAQPTRGANKGGRAAN